MEDEEKISQEKINHDEDLSDSENDSLLLDMNNQIEKKNLSNLFQDPVINESNSKSSITFEEDEKFLCHKRDKDIISNYIKNYFIKYKKYPKTKMNFYKYGRLLGKGAFGKVNLSLHVLTGRLVAIKSINKKKFLDEKQKEKIMHETSIMKILSKSNNIVKIFETFETKKHFCIVMEHIGAGNLYSYIKKRNQLPENIAKFIFKQIILSLQYMHSHNIIHRDIKLQNILIDLNNNIKLCDFSISKKVKKGEIIKEQMGTHAYLAPEILLNKGYDFGVDIWSAGVVLYAMLGGVLPFKSNDNNELNELIVKGQFNPIKNISPEATNLIRSILEVNPKKRISIKDILNHPWLINVDLNFWKTQNLFTNAEYIFLVKNNVDYRDINNKHNMIENFDIKNLDTIEENENKDADSRSFILTPYNSDIDNNPNNSDDDSIDSEYKNLEINNNIIQYNNKAKDFSRKYEMNNNEEIDNGLIDNNFIGENNILPSNGNFNNSEDINKELNLLHGNEENNLNMDNTKESLINEKAIEDLEELGFNKHFVRKSLMKNEFNYATTSYKLIVKYCYS